MDAQRKFVCDACHLDFDLPRGTGRPAACPACGSPAVRRAAADRGHRGAGRGRCRRTRGGRAAASPAPGGEA
jgi:DNA-directed RNA polymerase subunit RPC12/RpoP